MNVAFMSVCFERSSRTSLSVGITDCSVIIDWRSRIYLEVSVLLTHLVYSLFNQSLPLFRFMIKYIRNLCSNCWFIDRKWTAACNGGKCERSKN